MSTSNMTSSSFAGFIDSRARQPVALRFLTLVLTACLGIFIVILLFMAVWGVLYRLPHSAPGLVDLRSGKGNPRYVLLCCGLANNAHGFPGHCYVAWSSSQLSDLNNLKAKE